jgi:hypothetical protein
VTTRTNPIVVRATDEHAVAMAPHLRMVDCREIRVGADPLATIRESLAPSSHAWAWIVDGEPVCMFGVIPRSALGGVGLAWFMATERLPEMDMRTFLLGSRAAVQMLLGIYPRLEGVVDTRFTASVRWIQKMGFTFGPEVTVQGVPAIHFSLTR